MIKEKTRSWAYGVVTGIILMLLVIYAFHVLSYKEVELSKDLYNTSNVSFYAYNYLVEQGDKKISFPDMICDNRRTEGRVLSIKDSKVSIPHIFKYGELYVCHVVKSSQVNSYVYAVSIGKVREFGLDSFSFETNEANMEIFIGLSEHTELAFRSFDMINRMNMFQMSKEDNQGYYALSGDTFTSVIDNKTGIMLGSEWEFDQTLYIGTNIRHKSFVDQKLIIGIKLNKSLFSLPILRLDGEWLSDDYYYNYFDADSKFKLFGDNDYIYVIDKKINFRSSELHIYIPTFEQLNGGRLNTNVRINFYTLTNYLDSKGIIRYSLVKDDKWIVPVESINYKVGEAA